MKERQIFFRQVIIYSVLPGTVVINTPCLNANVPCLCICVYLLIHTIYHIHCYSKIFMLI